ncbi:CrcB family protein [Streptomyces durbertensis]|uniref:Fluoride-specific ion channel FluC n=1 Tax=Streptomyces durbertensis TaxID=2448886 RepID=A0ABR6EPA7_9ACTN|nr:CrcB family protein [Streptomyces durbertensis]MBB1247165.1 CrcB family protein [Streptomyces durbertensis]
MTGLPEKERAGSGARRAGRPRVLTRGQLPVVAVVAAGGALGAGARYGVALLLPTTADGFPWATFAVDVAGCALIGVLMAVVVDAAVGHRLLRPFLGTGVLGGFTTLSAYAGEADALLRAGHAATALTYLVGTLAAALSAVWAATVLTRRTILRRRV